MASIHAGAGLGGLCMYVFPFSSSFGADRLIFCCLCTANLLLFCSFFAGCKDLCRLVVVRGFQHRSLLSVSYVRDLLWNMDLGL
jgi:hypothetical protein